LKLDSTQEAWAMADYLSSDEIKEKSYDSSPVDGFPMIVNIEEIKEE
jgi:hypothetical protein